MLWETILLAQREIRRNAMRSCLTILGIVIGVASVITLVTLGGGATAKVTADITKLGSNLLQVRPGQHMRGPGGARISAEKFSIADAAAIDAEIAGLAAVAPADNAGTQAIFGSRNWSTSITGSTNAFLHARNWQLDRGRIFSVHELGTGASVCIIGATVKNELFGAQDALGESIRLKTLSFKVIGVLSAKGQSGFGSDQDDFILMPLKAFQRRISGDRDVSTIYLSARDGVSTEKVKADVEGLMRQRRNITGNREDDFYVRDMQEIVSTLTGTTRVLTTLLGAVAAVSLLVGGIGIMNIMLVSVTERTREIGIRLAIGALARQVLLQFLIEAVVLSALGGLVGILLGLGAAAVGAHILDVPFILNGGVTLLAFLFSAAVGVVFGYFPARQAARLDPIEALRYE